MKRNNLIFLSVIVLFCFAMNSLLCRWAIGAQAIDPLGFAAIRAVSGAFALSVLTLLTSRFTKPDWRAGLALAIYLVFFTFAYLHIDAGVGALLLFGSVQISMIGWSTWNSGKPTTRELTGLLLAVLGLAYMTLPGKSSPDFTSAVFMILAGAGWGAYSLLGRGVRDPRASTAASFLLVSIPLVVLFLIAGAPASQWSSRGIWLAFLSGSLTSGMGYALWYLVLPHLRVNSSAIIQLCVPVLAAVLGRLVLAENLGSQLLISGALTLSGVWIAVKKPSSSK